MDNMAEHHLRQEKDQGFLVSREEWLCGCLTLCPGLIHFRAKGILYISGLRMASRGGVTGLEGGSRGKKERRNTA